MKSLNKTVEKLARAQTAFLRAANSVPSEQWQIRPQSERWSAGELAGHLMITEEKILTGLDRLLQKPPVPRSFLKRFHYPLSLVDIRLIRVKAPAMVEGRVTGKKDEMLEELPRVRKRTLAFIEETEGRDLGRHSMPHPFLGSLTTYEWFEFIARHQIRHTKQMLEILKALPKNIAKLQN